MANQDPNRDFAAGFMDDYFAEADEHLVAVRRNLLVVESALGGELPAPALEELFRSFHSLKGISAMVEVREAEVLAHEMESCLRAVRQEELKLDPANFQVLVEGAKAIEDVIAACRHGQPAAPIGHALAALQDLIKDTASRTNSGTSRRPEVSGSSPLQGMSRWRVTFVSSPELVARGVKVDTIRARLLEIGQILSVAPRVTPSGGISFEFDLQTEHGGRLAAWRDDGVSSEPIGADAESIAGTAGRTDIPATAVARATPHELTSAPANFVRVDLSRLDDLMRLIGDMVVTRARLGEALHRIERHVPFQEWRALQDQAGSIERQLRDLREGVMRVRLVPVAEIFRRMPFVVRDLAHDTGKRVRLDLAGQSTEIDKYLIERMMDPFLHLVRNAISHAIETPDERIAAGKPPESTIRLAASTSGESVVLEVTDDGRGIDVPAVVARARAHGLAVPDGAIDARGLLDILCASGFSTRDEADRASGRGVGMSVVRSTIEELGGHLDVHTEPGRGTTFTVTLPLTLAITDAIIANVGSHTFAVPQAAVREVIEVDASALRSMERNELVTYRGGTLPIIRLARLFGIPGDERTRFHAIVVGTGTAAIGILVDRITGQREIVVKTITDPLIRVDGVSGATELGDGRLVLILDALRLGRATHDRMITLAERSA